MLGKPLRLECSTNLDKSLIKSIGWTVESKKINDKTIEEKGGTLEFLALKYHHHYQKYMCTIIYVTRHNLW